jgi:hypothetical protein
MSVHICEIDLPRLLERRLDTKLGEILPDTESRERLKKMVISELVICIKQLVVDPSETPDSFHDSQVLGHRQSGVPSMDSGYGSRCGSIDCTGNCSVCEQLVSPMSQQSQGHSQPVSSSSFDLLDQYFNPLMFTNAESAENLQSTENTDRLYDMDESELLSPYFPPPYSGHLYLHGSGT